MEPRQWLFEKAKETWPEIRGSVAELTDWYWRAVAAAIHPDEQVLAFLIGLSQAGKPWGIVTNGGPDQRSKARAAGFEAMLPFMVSSEESGYRKPDPRICQEAMKRLGEVPITSTLFVGDQAEADIVGAQAVGILTAWVRRGRLYPSSLLAPDYQIDHVSELGPLLLGQRRISAGC